MLFFSPWINILKFWEIKIERAKNFEIETMLSGSINLRYKIDLSHQFSNENFLELKYVYSVFEKIFIVFNDVEDIVKNHFDHKVFSENAQEHLKRASKMEVFCTFRRKLAKILKFWAKITRWINTASFCMHALKLSFFTFFDY